jgi:hypothetical protein
MRMLVRGNPGAASWFGFNIKDWDFQIPVLSEKFSIIPDFRGHGESGINNDDFGVEFLTEDIFQLLQN